MSKHTPKRAIKHDNEDDIPEEIVEISMSKQEAESRVIDPEEIVIGGKSSIDMYDFIPSENIKGAEDFIEESDYFRKQSKDMPFLILKEGVYEFPSKLDAFIYPDGVFDHFDAPTKPNSKHLLKKN